MLNPVDDQVFGLGRSPAFPRTAGGARYIGWVGVTLF
jgi:hypothetical protein